ncbi:hypothetical protein BGW42_008209 [Actinomortierella wolfii]|nr:hypothetical protein BGW42_008209 [Actinomortierella wolfii]
MSLVIGDFIGTGAYGSVYKGHWEGRAVAIKRFHITQQEAALAAAAAAGTGEGVQHEIEMLSQLRDKHIIQFYGTTFDGDDAKLVLAMEYAEGGSLHRAIARQRLVDDWPTKIRLAQEMTRGINYIHHKNILHRDLKSQNVLLTKHMEVKLCDFGLATVKIQSAAAKASTSNSMSGGGVDGSGNRSNGSSGSSSSNIDASAPKGTLRWMAPELLSKRPKYSTKSDMYALGMVMWEMAADCTMPFRHQPDNAVVAAMVKSGEREDLPSNTPPEYHQVVLRCWSHDPAMRPEAQELVTKDILGADHGGDRGGDGGTNETTGSFLSITITDNLTRLTGSLPLGGAEDHGDQNAEMDGTRQAGDSHEQKQEEDPQPEQKRTETSPQQSFPHDDMDPLMSRAKHNDIEAQLKIAAKYERIDDVKAFYWYNRAAEQGHVEAQYIVGDRFYTGQGTTQNYAEAVTWFRKAAEQKHANAQYRLGCMLRDGQGVEQNYDDAAKWLLRATEQGHAEARQSVKKLYEKGYGLPRDLQKAVHWYREVAAGGGSDVQQQLKKLVNPLKKKSWKRR